jgi:uncharacterized membrane protein
MPNNATLVWGAADWLPVAATAAAALLLLVVLGYRRAGAGRGVRLLAASLKVLGVLILALCLLEPLFSGTRARPGANQFLVLADNSRSMTLADQGAAGQTRAAQLKSLAPKSAAWLAKIGQDFDLRQYAFDAQVRPQTDFEQLAFDGQSSNLASAIDRVARRAQGRPTAGILVLTDGGATDAEHLERLLAASTAPGAPASAKLPPIYPVLIGRDAPPRDVAVGPVTVAQTNFEDTPVTLATHVTATGYRGRTIIAQLIDESGKPVEQHKLTTAEDAKPQPVRFSVKAQQAGVTFYRVRAAAEDELAKLDQPPDPSEGNAEATLANNTRTVAVDRGRGPYRVLYVAGRPNWEYKFLSRAVASDDQVQLAGLMRVAKREPKFNFLSRAGEQSNPLFRGFDNPQKQQIEQYDQPVIVRVGRVEEGELLGGFPKSAEELYAFHAVVLDDVEAEFFTQDQMQLLKEFVRQRGGGLLMLGGQESFKNGKFDRTPIGDLLPVYVDDAPAVPAGAKHRLVLTREGWLEPWQRLRPDEDAERKRLDAMPAFQTLNPVRGIKPGATVLARATPDGPDSAGPAVPALVEQRFGQGRVGALLIGDLWRWALRRPAPEQNDLDKAWRQTIRWLVADVPKRVELTTTPRRQPDDPAGALALSVQVRDPAYAPLDNAAVTIKVTPPDGQSVDLRAEPDPKQAGRYEALYVPRQPGAYRAHATAVAPDGSDVGQSHAGWTADPAADEFRDLRPNLDLLKRVATATGGQIVPASDLDAFAASLPTRLGEVTEPYVRPLWHQSWVFLLAIACLTAEWGLRRWKGLP